MAGAAPSVWKLHDSIGELRAHALAAQIDIKRPDRGLLQVKLEQNVVPGPLLCVRRDIAGDWPAAVADRYIRGNDLVATYAAGDDWPYAPQIYWRADALESVEAPLASLSLLISVQTHLLDTYPHVNIETQLTACEMFEIIADSDEKALCEKLPAGVESTRLPQAHPCCLLWRLSGGAVSYAEIMPASDFRQLSVHQDENGTCCAVWQVFADFLEKGVIRRARLHALFLPRENDVQLAAACCRAIERRPLPLTT